MVTVNKQLNANKKYVIGQKLHSPAGKLDASHKNRRPQLSDPTSFSSVNDGLAKKQKS